MVGAFEVVVDGFGDADDGNVVVALGKVSRKLVDGVHGIIAANVENAVDSKGSQAAFNVLVDGRFFGDFRKFVSTASQKARRRFGEKFHGVLLLVNAALLVCSAFLLDFLWKEQVGQVGIATIKKAFNSILHAVNFDAFFVRTRDNSCKGRIDCYCWTARLTDKYFSNLTHVPPCDSLVVKTEDVCVCMSQSSPRLQVAQKDIR